MREVWVHVYGLIGAHGLCTVLLIEPS